MTEIRGIWLHAHHMLRSARQILNENLRSLDLGSAEGNILLHLMTQSHEMGQEQLAEQLDISKPAVSRALDSLEVKGYVTRQQDPRDRRVQRVGLTANAQQIGPIIEEAYNRLYDIAVHGISQQELDDFLRLFGRISDNFMRAQSMNNTEEHHAA